MVMNVIKCQYSHLAWLGSGMPILHNHLLILIGPMRTLEARKIALNVTKVYSGLNWQHV